ncbi:protein TUNAR [Aplochiton taeniatus]
MSVHYGKPPLSSMSNAVYLLMLCKIGPREKLQTSGKMVNTGTSDEEKGIQDKEGKEESILAMLGIIGTILNLVVIIFVYIYTTL